MKFLKKAFIIIVFAALTLPANSQDIHGDWHGLLDMHNIQIRVVLHITEVNEGYSLTFDSPDQDSFGIPADTIFVEKNNFVFKCKGLDIIYTGVISNRKTFIEGLFSQHGDSVVLSFGRYPLQPVTKEK